jgi:hypothetical protein
MSDHAAQQICHAPDKADASTGMWLQTWTERVGGVSIQSHSTLGIIWRKIIARCRDDRPRTNKTKSYEPVFIEFTDFQDFAGWAVVQPGYGLFDEKGIRWSIDKDILSGSSKRYGRDTCCFIPRSLNSAVYSRTKVDGLPIGVSRNSRNSTLRAQCFVNGEEFYIGTFSDPFEAHRAWQLVKCKEVARLAEWFDGMVGADQRAVLALRQAADRIAYEAERGIETKAVLYGVGRDK